LDWRERKQQEQRDERIHQLEEAMREAIDFAEHRIRPAVAGSLADDLQGILRAALSPSEAPPRSYKLELLELIAKQAETYLLVSTPRETRLGGPAMSKRELETSLQELKDLESSEAPEKEEREDG
jgi:hypothetical protein